MSMDITTERAAEALSEAGSEDGAAAHTEGCCMVYGATPSQPDIAPLLQQRLRVVSALVTAGTFVALIVTVLAFDKKNEASAILYRGWLWLDIAAFLLNLGFLYLLWRAPIRSQKVLRVLDLLFFFFGALMFVAMPFLLFGRQILDVRATSAIVLMRCIFIPDRPRSTLFVSLGLWAVYPLSFLAAPMGPVDQIGGTERLWMNFILGNFDILLHLGMGMVAVYIFHDLRMRVFEAAQAGSYKLLEKLGEGGMGEVYRARHRLLHRPTAVKMLRADQLGSPTALKRFEREVRAVSELTHPHTIAIYDFGKTDSGRFYYAMEYLIGLDLQELVIRYGALPPARVVHVLEQALGSLGEAHWRGILHRDVKPGNIFLTVRGQEFDFVKVLDFGLVKEMGPDTRFAAGLTAEGAITGTPLYMAPERFYGDQEADLRSDLYAVGAVAYFLVTGHPVFEAKNATQVLLDHVKTSPVPPSTRGILLSAELEAAILKALEKEPAQRFSTAAEFAATLRATPEWGAWTQADAQRWWTLHLPESSKAAAQPITPDQRTRPAMAL